MTTMMRAWSVVGAILLAGAPGTVLVAQESNPIVVYVHGYGGHPLDTWRDVADIQPSNVVNGSQRAIVQGQDQYSIQFANPDGSPNSKDLRIFEQGDQLSLALNAIAEANPDRPLVIVTHSMGGIALRAALTGYTIENAPPEGRLVLYPETIKSIRSVVFIGVPQQGHGPAHLEGGIAGEDLHEKSSALIDLNSRRLPSTISYLTISHPADTVSPASSQVLPDSVMPEEPRLSYEVVTLRERVGFRVTGHQMKFYAQQARGRIPDVIRGLVRGESITQASRALEINGQSSARRRVGGYVRGDEEALESENAPNDAGGSISQPESLGTQVDQSPTTTSLTGTRLQQFAEAVNHSSHYFAHWAVQMPHPVGGHSAQLWTDMSHTDEHAESAAEFAQIAAGGGDDFLLKRLTEMHEEYHEEVAAGSLSLTDGLFSHTDLHNLVTRVENAYVSNRDPSVKDILNLFIYDAHTTVHTVLRFHGHPTNGADHNAAHVELNGLHNIVENAATEHAAIHGALKEVHDDFHKHFNPVDAAAHLQLHRDCERIHDLFHLLKPSFVHDGHACGNP